LKNLLFLLFFLVNIGCITLFSDTFLQGKELFEANDVVTALNYFEDALAFSPTAEVYKYLSESYTILGLYDDAVLVLEEALLTVTEERAYFYFKLGNAYYSIGNYQSALDNYLEVITLNKEFTGDAFLNVANVAVELKLFQIAIDNYTKFIELSPNDPQRRKIARLILLLKKNLREDEAEAQKLAQTQADIEMEKERLDKEARDLDTEKEDLKNREELVLNPPDPEIEQQKLDLAKKEEELKLWEETIKRREEELEAEKLKLTMEKEKSSIPENVTNNIQGLEEPENLKHKAIMSDILKSLEKIGENAKTIGASSEDVIDDLEGSDIDE